MSKKKENTGVRWVAYPQAVGGLLAGGFILVSSAFLVGNMIKEENETKKFQNSYEVATLINDEIFKEAYTNYDEYIDLIAKAVKNSDMNNSSMEVFVAYKNMEENGWISLGDKFTYKDPSFEPLGNAGISVVFGEGVCRNQAFNLFKVFDSLGYESGVVYGNIYTDKPSDENGHAVAYVKDGNHLYLYDPTNKTIFLRDFWGHFVSIDDENIKFYPDMFVDNKFNQLGDNLGVYTYFGEDYGSKVTYRTRRRKAQEKLDGLGDYYKEYEEAYLQYYEELIALEKYEYDSIVEQILAEREEKPAKGKNQ